MITTHVLDLGLGSPGAGITVILELRQQSEWTPIARGTTDENGRLMTLTDDRPLTPGTYRLTFDIGAYHRGQGFTTPFFRGEDHVQRARHRGALSRAAGAQPVWIQHLPRIMTKTVRHKGHLRVPRAVI